MLYQVSRASNRSPNFKPCEEAVEIDTTDSNFKYAVAVNTLEELQSFITKYGDCIVGENYITIYDYYIE